MGHVMTVNGPIPVEDLGFTLPHEHVLLNMMREHRATGLLHDPELLARELGEFHAHGGRTLVECTNMGLGRDPNGLRAIAERSSLNIVMGSGLYRDPYLDREWVDERSVDEIAEIIVRDLVEGVDGTSVRAGIIGEIGADKWYVSALEERSFRAAARAHLTTGVTITTHAARWPVGRAQLGILMSEGVDPANVIVGHTDTVPMIEYHEELADLGAWVQYDSIRGQSDYDTEIRIGYILHMIRRGHADRLLISQDVCNRSHLRVGGGTGYAYIIASFLDLLRENGVSDEEIHLITVVNPRRALAGES